MSEKGDADSPMVMDNTFYVSMRRADGSSQEVGRSECVDTVFQIARRTMKAHGVLIVKVINCPSGKRALVIRDAADLVPFTVSIAGCCIALPDDPFVPDPNYCDYVSLVEEFHE